MPLVARLQQAHVIRKHVSICLLKAKQAAIATDDEHIITGVVGNRTRQP